MKNYFMSYVIKHKLPEGGHMNAGYGHAASSALPDVAINEVLCEMVKGMAGQFGVLEKQIHVTQFNSV